MNWISVKFHQILMRRLQDNVVYVTGQNRILVNFFLTQVNFQFPLFIFLALIIHELGLGDKGN